MIVLKLIAKAVILPAVVAVTLIQWFMAFLIGFSSIVFNLLAGLFLLVAVLSYLMGLSAGDEAVKMIVAGFIVFMVPIAGEWIVTAITVLNMGMRNFIRSWIAKLITKKYRRYFLPEPSCYHRAAFVCRKRKDK